MKKLLSIIVALTPVSVANQLPAQLIVSADDLSQNPYAKSQPPRPITPFPALAHEPVWYAYASPDQSLYEYFKSYNEIITGMLLTTSRDGKRMLNEFHILTIVINNKKYTSLNYQEFKELKKWGRDNKKLKKMIVSAANIKLLQFINRIEFLKNNEGKTIEDYNRIYKTDPNQNSFQFDNEQVKQKPIYGLYEYFENYNQTIFNMILNSAPSVRPKLNKHCKINFNVNIEGENTELSSLDLNKMKNLEEGKNYDSSIFDIAIANILALTNKYQFFKDHPEASEEEYEKMIAQYQFE
ncbi:hypothetical protein FACS1894113_4780 [Alphaproteobacteria bacterium]|nr:hypothetical protein FACS1894113_4780 [Alphaproteobacteria bacterium]